MPSDTVALCVFADPLLSTCFQVFAMMRLWIDMTIWVMARMSRAGTSLRARARHFMFSFVLLL